MVFDLQPPCICAFSSNCTTAGNVFPGHAMSAQLVDKLFAVQCDPDTDDNPVFTALDAFHLSFAKLPPVHHIVASSASVIQFREAAMATSQ